MDEASDRGAAIERRRKWSVFLLAGSVLLLLIAFFPRIHTNLRAKPSGYTPTQQTVTVERKSFSHVLRLSGTTQAARSFIVSAPQLEGAQLNNLNITSIVEPGAAVQTGDVLVRFDPQAQVKDFLEKQKTYTDLVSQVEQKEADAEIAKAKDDTALAKAETALKKAELEVQRNEIVSRIDAEKNQLALEEAQSTLKQVKQTYDLKRKAANAATKIVEIQRDRALEAMRYAQSNADKMTIHAPMDGVAVMNTVWLGSRMGTVQKGDSVQPGVPFMQLVDPSKMEVRATVSQSDFGSVRVGQTATVRFDAYPEMTLPATLAEVSPLGEQGKFSEKVRTFAALFTIQGSNPRLLPDLSAALDIVLDSKEQALAVPRAAVASRPDGEFVWVKAIGGYERREVKVGPMSDTEAVIVSGVSQGDVLRLSTTDSDGADKP
ncbi:MAG TPA: HlyD family efflux transporter periplasmic adaptor subunit [Candidatus Limnocylindrales bacterium]|nr:HlyD family efflux transporter periplasmic adaptor subunit [Candidatus Limnocylindrales bacterium]